MDFNTIIDIIDKGGTLALLALAVWHFNTKVSKLETINVELRSEYEKLLVELRIKYEELLVKVGAVDAIKTLEVLLDEKLSQFIEKIKK